MGPDASLDSPSGEDISQDPLELLAYTRRKQQPKTTIDTASTTSSTYSDSAMLMSVHIMSMGCYKINLGNITGQRLNTCHLILLPLIPVFILLFQNTNTYITNQQRITDLEEVIGQVNNAIDFARLTRTLQEERIAVALDFFVGKRENLTSLIDLDQFTETDEAEFIESFSVNSSYRNTDIALLNVSWWPVDQTDYMESKLKFQIKHALFRSQTNKKQRDGRTDEVLDWYNQINSKTLNYVTYSIKDSDISNFYRYIIGYKNLLRSVEFAGKAGILGLEYTTNGLDAKKFKNFLEFDVLRRSYLNQTTNFLPYIEEEYSLLKERNTFDESQSRIRNKEHLSRDIKVMVEYFFEFTRYTNKLREMIKDLGETLDYFVSKDIDTLNYENITPLCYIVILMCFIPICIIFTLNITGSMIRFSSTYNDRVGSYKSEKKKTEKLLGSLLPSVIIKQMKRGLVPRPEVFDNTTVFFCDIVSFTTIASESTASQIIDFLNDLYSLFDNRIDNYDVYKVETIGDAYMVASGVPVSNGNQHAVEISRMSLDLLARILTFEIKHKPGFRLKLVQYYHPESKIHTTLCST